VTAAAALILAFALGLVPGIYFFILVEQFARRWLRSNTADGILRQWEAELTKRQEQQRDRIGELMMKVAVEAAKNEYPDEVRQKLALARVQLEAAHSLITVPSK
jgi:hypothetical protein